MPRNRSEKSVTGDAEVDAALRAYSEFVEYEEDDEDEDDSAFCRWSRKYTALSSDQRSLYRDNRNNIPKELRYVQR